MHLDTAFVSKDKGNIPLVVVLIGVDVVDWEFKAVFIAEGELVFTVVVL